MEPHCDSSSSSEEALSFCFSLVFLASALCSWTVDSSSVGPYPEPSSDSLSGLCWISSAEMLHSFQPTLRSRAISSCWVRMTSSLSASCWRMWRCSCRSRASSTSNALSTRPSCSFRNSLTARTSASFSCSLVAYAATSCRQRTVCRRSAVRVSSSSRRNALISHSIFSVP